MKNENSSVYGSLLELWIVKAIVQHDQIDRRPPAVEHSLHPRFWETRVKISQDPRKHSTGIDHYIYLNI